MILTIVFVIVGEEIKTTFYFRKGECKMTKKFTEEQYQKIVKAWQSENTYVHQTEAVIDYLIDDLNVDVTLMGDEAIALANPLTREWAHDKFVEKEKKYVWSSKKADRDSNVLTLYIDEYGMVSTSYRKVHENNLRNENMLITESEIRAWGYNPEMFDREEVE